ncbi:ATP-binding protein [Enterococcus faecalis]|uniref:ATP-binding protein n=1 Tax=Enterococcus faecalis TaxID=1351 RepID=UPI000416E5F8|nr:ATP-binding protein [Enterococcus faecalis]
MVEVMKIVPETRILKMLGEDLIKDEKTALIELVKNSYDADATDIKIFFKNFEDNFELNDGSEIYIVDNGDGMTKNEIVNNWLSPGTANKRRKKKMGEKTKLGRVYQGEKGIGRYSILKLGKTVELFTKTSSEKKWNHAKLDLSTYDSEYFESPEGTHLLSELEVVYEEKNCDDELVLSHLEDKGTILKLSNLNGIWNAKKVNEIYDDLARLEPISKIIHGWSSNKNIESYVEKFSINLFLNGKETSHKKLFLEDVVKFLNLLEKKCLVSITNGKFDDKTGNFEFYLNGSPHIINFQSTSFTKYPAYKRYFLERENFKIEDLRCGGFNFEFYAFNFSSRGNYLKNYVLTAVEKELVEKHRIYLYRDNARVYPYGEAKNDWFEIDALRGLIRANEFLTNGQTVGFVSISHSENPLLRDKTNREGLIEDGEVTFEFVALLQSFLNYLRRDIYETVLDGLKEEELRVKREADRKAEEMCKDKEAEEQKAEEIRKAQEAKKKKTTEGQSNNETIGEKEKLGKKELELSDREKRLAEREKEVTKQERRVVDNYIGMKVEKTEFFKQSNIVTVPANLKVTIDYNELLKQVTSLDYETHYLVYVMAFRALTEDLAKKYIGARELTLKAGLGEKIASVIDDLKDITKQKDTTLTKPQKEELQRFFGGHNPFNNQLDVIKDKFHKEGKQQILATKLNTFAHTPVWMNQREALDIANNVILPLMLLSDRVIVFLQENQK